MGYSLYLVDGLHEQGTFPYTHYDGNTNRYLVYSKKKPEVGQKVSPNTVLSAEESLWLTGCKLQINAKAMEKHMEVYTDLVIRFADTLKKELEQEACKERDHHAECEKGKKE